MKSVKYISIILFVAAGIIGTAFAKQPHHGKSRNEQIVTTFYNAVINEKNYQKAEKYLSDKYIQHSPTASEGKKGLKQFINYLSNNYPQASGKIERVIVDGEYVVLHVRSVRVPGKIERAVVDIFRVAKGKVVEHWDVTERLPNDKAKADRMF